VHRHLRSDSSSQDEDFHQRAAATTCMGKPKRMQPTNVARGDKLEKRIIYPNYDEYEGEVLNSNVNQSLPGEKASLLKNSPENEKSPHLQQENRESTDVRQGYGVYTCFKREAASKTAQL